MDNQLDIDFFPVWTPEETPSTEITEVYKKQGLSRYMAKYISKSDEDSEPIPGKIWDASKAIKQSPTFQTYPTSAFNSYLSDLQTKKVFRVISRDFTTLCISPHREVLKTLSTAESIRFMRLKKAIWDNKPEIAKEIAFI